MSSLEGKVVLVTGASSGIGLAAARAFAARGCRLVLAARRVEKLQELSRELSGSGAESIEVPCDVRDRVQARRAVEAAVERWGRLDVLINNAGINRSQPFERQSLDDLDDILRTNLLGAAYVLHAALVPMRRQGEGHIVNVASIAGLIGLPFMAAYCASKFALVGLTESLRRELLGTGVTLTAFCPGTVDTPMITEAASDPKLSKLMRPKSAEATAERMVRSVLRKEPVVVFGEVPGALLTLTRFAPGFTDWAASALLRRFHPAARRMT